MKNLLFLLTTIFTIFTPTTFSQCTNNVYGLYASLTPNCTGTWQTVTTCGWRGEYSNITVIAGNSYSFASSIGSDIVTITTTANAILSWGTGTTTWTATLTGTIRYYTHVPGCITGTGCRTRRVMCSGPPPAPSCTDNPLVINMYDSWGDGWNGATYTIINDANGSTVGSGTLSTGSSGTSSIYCVLDGCYTIVVTDGTFPTEVSWTATINGVVYASGGAGSSTQLPINSFCTPPTPEMKIPSIGTNSYNVCEGVLYDNGGSIGNYSVNANGYTTLYPGTAGSMVSVTFTSFNLETNWDYVYVYDGNNTAAPLLGVFTGTNLPGNFISTASDGSLTLRLTSDGSIQYAGFSAEISCLTPLPVEMLSYGGVNKGEYNHISWVTSSEYNSDYFLIRHSIDGINWESVDKVSSIGNTSIGSEYSLNDYRITDVTYYKITQFDFNGVYREYPPFSVTKNSNNGREIIKYVDVSGREILPSTMGLVIILYSDGTIERVFN